MNMNSSKELRKWPNFKLKDWIEILSFPSILIMMSMFLFYWAMLFEVQSIEAAQIRICFGFVGFITLFLAGTYIGIEIHHKMIRKLKDEIDELRTRIVASK